MKLLELIEQVINESKESCPKPAVDLELNTKNREKA